MSCIFIFEKAGTYRARRGAGTSIFGAAFLKKKKTYFSQKSCCVINVAQETYGPKIEVPAPRRARRGSAPSTIKNKFVLKIRSGVFTCFYVT